MGNYFEIKDLKVNFKTSKEPKNVLDINRFNLDKGESFGIVGESGAGKSILAQSILGILPSPPAFVESGKITFKGQDLLKLKEKEMQNNIRGKRISMIFQDPMSTLNPVFRVGQQIMNVIRHHNKHLNKREAEKEVLRMLKLVKLGDVEDTQYKYPHELSGGQRQRIIIAIALSCGAELLIADEPTRNLDVTIQAGILKLICGLKEELGITILFIANNINIIFIVSNKIAVLYKGKIIEMGASQEIKKNSLHPYTKELLGITLPVDRKIKNLTEATLEEETKVDNSVCPYFYKCEKRMEICKKISPTLTKVNNSHWVNCHRVIDREVDNESSSISH
ncbi:ABC transporter ATP-binding protein [Candidatus Atribacteria bacterium 1244-E10-H5-B2]|nr:MAG: ABC transporter ATP-binding protein [Candidatus Atribacteria bacterium 1244-E10-H5-B2]